LPFASFSSRPGRRRSGGGLAHRENHDPDPLVVLSVR